MTESLVDERPAWLVAALRSDHAGETGAVALYHGILAVSRDPVVIEFARRHMATERRHLEEISAVLPPNQRSLLIPIWRCLGWVTGALPAVVGANAVFATIESVETFVDRHYQVQIDRLRIEGRDATLLALLERLQRDEVEHLSDATKRKSSQPQLFLRTWTRLVTAGSTIAVFFARLF